MYIYIYRALPVLQSWISEATFMHLYNMQVLFTFQVNCNLQVMKNYSPKLSQFTKMAKLKLYVSQNLHFLKLIFHTVFLNNNQLILYNN